MNDGGVETFSCLGFKRGSHRRAKYSQRHCSSSSSALHRRLRRSRWSGTILTSASVRLLVSGLFTGGVDCCWLVSRLTVLFNPFLTRSTNCGADASRFFTRFIARFAARRRRRGLREEVRKTKAVPPLYSSRHSLVRGREELCEQLWSLYCYRRRSSTGVLFAHFACCF